MWPFRTETRTETKNAIDELIDMIENEIELNPDKFYFLKSAGKYWYRLGESGPYINGRGDLSVGIRDFEKLSTGQIANRDSGPALDVSKPQELRIMRLFNQLGAIKSMRNILRGD